jgi:hypothetical protein
MERAQFEVLRQAQGAALDSLDRIHGVEDTQDGKLIGFRTQANTPTRTSLGDDDVSRSKPVEYFPQVLSRHLCRLCHVRHSARKVWLGREMRHRPQSVFGRLREQKFRPS